MESLTLFIIASLALIVTPGPDVIYVLTRGVAQGKLAGLFSALGVTSGILVHTLTASLGLAVLLQTSTYAFWILKIAGGIYLFYVGIQMIRNRSAFEFQLQEGSTGLGKCYIQGFFSNVLNPKVALFFVAFLPQFVNPDAQNRGLNMVGLGLLFASMTIAFLSLLGVSSGLIGSWLRSRGGAAGKLRWASGLILMLLGVRLLASQRS